MNKINLIIPTGIIFSMFLLVGSVDANIATINIPQKDSKIPISATSIPQNIVQAIYADLSKRGFETKKITIVSASSKTWPDGCLGLPQDRPCTMALVPGWRVTVRDEKRTGIYRTDNFGYKIYLESFS